MNIALLRMRFTIIIKKQILKINFGKVLRTLN